ncbi:uncharacterized protein LOC131148281 [Malania oleifera]|uniref:uncharacterized protein LOC131148281 n=1 Tax=Malania oleifera TaxID=397392 RepID=UPI0025AE6109|nr:uncharacterized protein LOC131148281 [Malania oleifera]
MDLERLGVELVDKDPQEFIANITIQPTFQERIKVAQKEDAELVKVMKGVQDGLKLDFNILDDGVLRFHIKICVLNDTQMKRLILWEAHRLLYTIHPKSMKMYRDLREYFGWPNMKRKIARFV